MIYFIIFTFFAGGLFAIFSDVLGLPPIATAKGIKIAVKTRQSIVDSILTVVVMPIVKIVSPFIIIAEYKEKRMAKQLVRAGIPLTPKEYYARSLVVAILSTVIAYVLLSFAVKSMVFISFIFGIVMFFHFQSEIKDKLKAKDRLIEAELPKFIRAIVQGLRTEKDIIKLLETYQTIAGEGLRYDIEVLIMDLKSGNFEEGMTEFEKRLGNSYVSRLAKALIAVNRGDDQSSMLNYLLSDMGLLAKEMMQRELNKRPGRVKMLVIPIVLVAVVALFYVIGANLFSSLGGIL